MSQMPDPTTPLSPEQLQAAWAALAEGRRHSDEVVRRRLAELDERAARLDVVQREVELERQLLEAGAQKNADARRELEAAAERLAERERAVADRERRAEGVTRRAAA